MRKDVKRARLWLINNLSQRVKKLNERKGTEIEIEKNLRKSERFRREIQQLKDVDVDEVSKFALCNNRELTTNNNLLELDQQVLLRLANHQIIKNQVAKFRQNYAIPVDRLILLVRSLGLQYQKKKKKKMDMAAEDAINCAEDFTTDNSIGKKLSTQPDISLKQSLKTKVIGEEQIEFSSKPNGNLKSKKSNIATNKAPNTTKKSNSLSMNSKSEEICEDLSMCDQDILSSTVKSSIYCGNENNDETVSENTSVHVSQTQFLVNKDGAHRKTQWQKLLCPQINKKVGSMEIKQIRLDHCEAETIVPEQSPKIDDFSKNILDLPRDSFFLGGIDIPSNTGEDERGPASLQPSR